MSIHRRGTEYEGIPEIVSPGQSIPDKKPRGLCNRGRGNKQPTDTDPGEVSIFCLAGVGCETRNISGNPITLLNLEDLNANLNEQIYLLPGGASDHNNIQWKFPVPSNMKADSPIMVRLHLIGRSAEGTSSVQYTMPFLSDAMGMVDDGGSYWTFSYEGTTGAEGASYPYTPAPGSLKVVGTGFPDGTYTGKMHQAPVTMTWEDMGVPAGKLAITVQLLNFHQKVTSQNQPLPPETQSTTYKMRLVDEDYVIIHGSDPSTGLADLVDTDMQTTPIYPTDPEPAFDWQIYPPTINGPPVSSVRTIAASRQSSDTLVSLEWETENIYDGLTNGADRTQFIDTVKFEIGYRGAGDTLLKVKLKGYSEGDSIADGDYGYPTEFLVAEPQSNIVYQPELPAADINNFVAGKTGFVQLIRNGADTRNTNQDDIGFVAIELLIQVDP